MSNKVVVDVKDVSMEFNLNQEKTDNLKEYVIKAIKKELRFQSFWALKHISLQIHKGEKVGFVGLNGAGKSTLLKIIAQVMKPTKGSVEVHGNMAPLLALGAGFDYNYTGSENIFLNGALLGHSKSYMKKRYDEIVEFSEIGDFIDVPVKNYSSGMKARLAFSIATSVNPDILILDEVLSVGDASFQKKSKERMNELMQGDVSLLFVSHSIGQVREMCDRAIWLDHGNLMMDGDVDEVCDAYMDFTKK
ncbi:MAG: ABC transporter ATP-binding protein [Methanosphaera sp.]|jgi:ABC-type polysaccharide/polyol phosphate transport system ATPase subunit|uniref:ABC transporter ATP-binding protein n=1 Tax=Methanosphaera TaxID=2316 RepID=UPI0023808F2D|nr:ABC transporter ATP-binding protein [Candidatus Methanosphaera massiliense]MDD6285319.1 ABC transporter ATP-binding protein [Methanobacteriaceae archaeon]MDE4078203.1 ABC transporter ATP-binding protein [Candidatus Methanosphaera massiliense]MDY2745412.1 ABC transporter ATP-binding protein [Methanosphaera sp.]